MLKVKYDSLIVSGRFGDGCIHKNSKREDGDYNIGFNSINLDYLEYKRDRIAKLIKVSRIRTQESGYKKGNISYVFNTHASKLVTKIKKEDSIKLLDNLSREALVLFYLDDGSYHQKGHFTHLYCNSFNSEEVEALRERIYELYPVKIPNIRVDRKSDGREYPYLYIPVPTTKEFIKDVKRFLVKNDIQSMMYKVGE